MNTLVIKPSDVTTDFLKMIYINQPWKVIDQIVTNEELMQHIQMSDRVVMLGHGTPSGLLGFGGYVIDSSFGEILKTKTCVSIWCNADQYCFSHGIKGLQTGMIVSELDEAVLFDLPAEQGLIDESNMLFSLIVKDHLWKRNGAELIRREYDSKDNPIIQFNRRNIHYR